MLREDMGSDKPQRVLAVSGYSKEIGKTIANEFAKSDHDIVRKARDERALPEAINDGLLSLHLKHYTSQRT